MQTIPSGPGWLATSIKQAKISTGPINQMTASAVQSSSKTTLKKLQTSTQWAGINRSTAYAQMTAKGGAQSMDVGSPGNTSLRNDDNASPDYKHNTNFTSSKSINDFTGNMDAQSGFLFGQLKPGSKESVYWEGERKKQLGPLEGLLGKGQGDILTMFLMLIEKGYSSFGKLMKNYIEHTNAASGPKGGSVNHTVAPGIQETGTGGKPVQITGSAGLASLPSIFGGGGGSTGGSPLGPAHGGGHYGPGAGGLQADNVQGRAKGLKVGANSPLEGKPVGGDMKAQGVGGHAHVTPGGGKKSPITPPKNNTSSNPPPLGDSSQTTILTMKMQFALTAINNLVSACTNIGKSMGDVQQGINANMR